MIEIPAAALMAGEIIDAGADFLAVDLDDLVQYTCGVSRRESPPLPITLPCCVWCRM